MGKSLGALVRATSQGERRKGITGIRVSLTLAALQSTRTQGVRGRRAFRAHRRARFGTS
jgi:hypothetical protein